MGKRLGAAGEPHGFTEIIPTGLAEVTAATHDTRLDGDSLSRVEIAYAHSDRHDGARCLVTEDKGVLDGEITIPALQIVVHWEGQSAMDRGKTRNRTHDRYRTGLSL